MQGPLILAPCEPVRLLCISDIHGHADALSAVLATAERRGYQRVLVAGDLCFPGPEPMATWRRLRQIKALCVQGVGDRAIATVDLENLRARDDHERERLQRLHDVRAELGDAILNELAKLPRVTRVTLDGGRQVILVHGCPLDPTEPMTHDMDDSTIAAMLGEEPADLVLCGASHVPFDRVVQRKLDGGEVFTRVVNVGSVGEAPTMSAEATGAPRFAHATFVHSTDGGIDVEQFVVPLGRAA